MTNARSRLLPRAVVSCLSLALSLALVGCGADDGLGKRYPISGKVLLNGEPLPKGDIYFISDDFENGHSATGKIVDGVYNSVTTRTPGDGILPGKYHVTISAKEEVDLSEAQTAIDPSGMDQVAVAKVRSQAKNLVNPRYASPSTSGLTAEITPDKSEYDFSLTD